MTRSPPNIFDRAQVSSRVRETQKQEKEIARRRTLDTDLRHVLESFVAGGDEDAAAPLPLAATAAAACVVGGGSAAAMPSAGTRSLSPLRPAAPTTTTRQPSTESASAAPDPAGRAAALRFVAQHGRAGGNSGVTSLTMCFIENLAAFSARSCEDNEDETRVDERAAPFSPALVDVVCKVISLLEPHRALWSATEAPHCGASGGATRRSGSGALNVMLFCAEVQFEQCFRCYSGVVAGAKAQRTRGLNFVLRVLHAASRSGLILEAPGDGAGGGGAEGGAGGELDGAATCALRYGWLCGRVHNALRRKDHAVPPFRRCAELLADGCAGIVLLVPQAADERTISASTVATRLDTLEVRDLDYRYISCESFSPFDSLPLIYL